MMEKILTLLVGLLIALGGWSLSRTFELSTGQAVLLNQVDQLEFNVQMLEEKIDKMMDSDKDIMDQHKKLFENSNVSNYLNNIFSNNLYIVILEDVRICTWRLYIYAEEDR